MMEVHEDGKSDVSSGSREEMERDVQAMHGYGLWATLEKSDVSTLSGRRPSEGHAVQVELPPVRRLRG